MSSQPVVSNSSPLIAFEQLGRLELLHELVGPILIPTALEAVKPCLDQLLSQDFRVSTDLYGQVLRDAGEAPESTDS